MRRRATTVLALIAAIVPTAPGAVAQVSAGCPAGNPGLGVSRIVEIDTSAGPLYGEITRYTKEDRFLGPREVVLTFDDGPMPWITKSILDTLDRFCTKATFFSVGRMALAYPDSVKDVIARGHTLGGHTHTHPLNIARLKSDRATDEIERGFAAIALAAGQPIAPFFRFPGLSDSPGLLAHLQTRGIATFSVDVVSNDSFIGDANRLARLTLERIEQRQGGIVLFHDIKSATAKALPVILTGLVARGYKIVHMRAKTPLTPVAHYETELLPKLAKAQPRSDGKPQLLPFFGTTGPLKVNAAAERSAPPPTVAPVATAPAVAATVAAAQAAHAPEVTTLAPPPRQRLASLSAAATERSGKGERKLRAAAARRGTTTSPVAGAEGSSSLGGWAIEIKPSRRPPAE